MVAEGVTETPTLVDERSLIEVAIEANPLTGVDLKRDGNADGNAVRDKRTRRVAIRGEKGEREREMEM